MSTHARRRPSPSHRMLVVLAAGALAVAACGNSGNDNSAATTQPPTTPPASTQPIATQPATIPPAGTEPAGTEPAATGTANTQPASTEPDVGEFQPIQGVPGVTDKQISFAVLGTGPSNPLGYCLLECFLAGVKAHFDYRNSLGGVHGRQLVVSRVVDDEVANTQVKALELIDATDIFGIFGATLLYAGYSNIADAAIPLYTTFPAAPDANGHDSMYIPVGTGCSTCPSPMTVWTGVIAGATKAASIGLGVSQASKDCVASNEAAFKKYGPGAGIEFVYKNDTLPFGFPNGLGPEVTAMKAAGVDFITTCIDQNSTLTLEQELERQGMGDVVVVLPQGYGDTGFISSNASLLEGDLIGLPFRPLEADPDSTMVPTMLKWLEASGVLINDYTVQGWLDADLAVTGLLAAGPQFDRASVITATNKITDWTAGGLVAPVDWTKAHNAPTVQDAYSFCEAYVFVRGGKQEVAGDPKKPFYCFDLPMDTWAEPTSKTFT